MNPVVLLIVGLFQQKYFLVGKDDVITSVLSKELSSFLDSCSFLSLGQAVNFLFFVWLQFQIIFNNGSKRYFTYRPVALSSDMLLHLLNHFLGSHSAFYTSFCSKTALDWSPYTFLRSSRWIEGSHLTASASKICQCFFLLFYAISK
jgi:hypothetical protein